VFFRADGGEGDGLEMWTSDGTPAGTRQVKDINPDGDSVDSFPWQAAVGNVVYFVADDGEHGLEVWRSDGTEAGTKLLKDTGSDDGDLTQPRNLYGYQGVLYFLAGNTVWTSDGTTAGTRPATGPQFVPEPAIGFIDTGEFTGSGNAVFFAGNDGSSGRELWKVTPPTPEPITPDPDPANGGGNGNGGSSNPVPGNPNPNPDPLPNPGPSITDSNILAALKKLSGLSVKGASASFTQDYVTPGSAQWFLQMTVPGKASAAAKVTLGTARKTIKKAGRTKVTIKLNKRGKKLLRGKRRAKLTIETRFKRTGSKKTLRSRTTKTVKVKR
jgi:ELWxxDGT repeat protein